MQLLFWKKIISTTYKDVEEEISDPLSFWYDENVNEWQELLEEDYFLKLLNQSDGDQWQMES